MGGFIGEAKGVGIYGGAVASTCGQSSTRRLPKILYLPRVISILLLLLLPQPPPLLILSSRFLICQLGNFQLMIEQKIGIERLIHYSDNRKISVGDCALFKPPQDSPPFIGLICCLTLSEEKSLHLGVNWLYRPAELKLGKGTLLDGAPNEIFYSFHKDEIPAASLLHPCKVAFLPRGVELPTGTSSFVCRRVYDIANKCLWWLTDQDYINERQEEVDQLLYKTRTEMHAMLQSGDRSPKQVNGPSSTAQLKPGCDSSQNSGTSFASQVKGKKRERGDHCADPIKRERPSRADDGESFQGKPTANLKSEIARITEKGGVMDLDGVEKLVQLMQADRMERNRDLLSRSMLAGVMAATNKDDCLHRFVQLRGLPVLDEWLQDIHKGKIGDGNSLKDGDKSVEEFLLVLLRALDKLPVDLQALQTCNIGKSVNHLRSHKNFDIQKKARSLVDTWKKKVEAEMISIDTESGSTQAISGWPSKPRLPEASHSGSRTPSGSDIAVKSSVTQSSASKTTSARSSHGESNIKSATSSPGPLKLASSPASGKESQPRVSVGGTPDVSVIREDRRSNSNQSNNVSQSGKEDGKSSSAGVMTVNKILSSSTRNRKISGFPGVSVTGTQKETSSGRGSSAHRNTVLEKSQSASTCERVLEVPITEGNSHKLIVKIPNPTQSPADGVGGESLEDPTFMSSRASSPVPSDKHDEFDCNAKDKGDAYRSNVASDMNMDSWQTIDSKVLSTVSGEGAGSPAAVTGVEQSMTTEDSRRLTDATPTSQFKPSKLHALSFNSMNALIESFVKYSGVNSSLSLEDDVGMNLLASVATGEIHKTDLVSPTDSTERSTAEENCVADEAKSKSSSENYIAPGRSQFCTDAECDDKKQAVLGSNSFSEDKLSVSKKVSIKFSGDKQCGPSHTSEDMPTGEDNEQLVSSSRDLKSSADPKCETSEKSYGKSGATSTLPISTEKIRDGQSSEEIQEEKACLSNVSVNGILNCKSEEINVVATEEKAGTVVGEVKPMVETAGSNQLCEVDCKKDSKDRLSAGTNLLQKVTATVKSEFAETENREKLHKSVCGPNSVSDSGDEVKLGKPDENEMKNFMNESERLNSNKEVGMNADIQSQCIAGSCSSHNDLESHEEADVENKKIIEHRLLDERECTGSVNHESQQKAEVERTKSATIQLDEVEKCITPVAEASSSAAGETDTDVKIKFDLNEGFSTDDGKYGEPVTSIALGSTTANMINSLSFSVNSVPSCHSASITVAAAAKGPFVHPEDLMRNKGELGWKGSAATSAFRPAEPRKFLEIPFGSTNMPCSEASTGKQGRIPLDIDLNVPDERVLEEMASRDSALAVDLTHDFVSNHITLLNEAPVSLLVRGSGGLDLDLNRVVEANDNANCSTSSYIKGEGSVAHIKPLRSLPTGDIRRDFDLNDGPAIDNANAEQFSISKQVKGGIPSQLASAGLRMNSPGLGNFSSWFPPGNTYSTVSIPSILPDRGDQPFPVFPPGAPQRTFGPISVTSITPDVYRGSVLSSSPAVPFPSSPFQFPIFPFGTTFPLPSATFPVGANSYADSSSGARLLAPPVNSQFLGPVVSVTSQFQRPFVVNVPDSSSNGGLENNRKWGRQGLDLNAGPGAMESEAREESSMQHSVVNSQPVVEEQARMYSVSGGILKRKEPDGGWDNENFRYMQFSRQ